MRNKFALILTAFSLVAAAVVFILNYGNSNDQRDKYGKSYNSERLKKHIPMIENDWMIHWRKKSYQYWSKPSNSVEVVTPVHFSKTLNFIGNELMSEEDDFHNETNGPTAYKLLVTFNYRNIDSSKFELIEYYKRGFPPSKNKLISFPAADSILKKWDFKNFYSDFK